MGQALQTTRVLVLDATFRPSRVVTWQTAMTLLAKGSARTVVSYPDLVVHSASDEWEVPAVLHSRGKDRKRKKGVTCTRKRVYRRDGYCCMYCGEAFEANELTLDHVIPKSRGGKHEWDNLVSACKACNQRKRDRTPAEAGMSILNIPCAPDYMPFDVLHDLKSVPEQWRPYL